MVHYNDNYLQQESPPPPGVPIGRQARVERVQTARMITMVMSLVMFGISQTPDMFTFQWHAAHWVVVCRDPFILLPHWT